MSDERLMSRLEAPWHRATVAAVGTGGLWLALTYFGLYRAAALPVGAVLALGLVLGLAPVLYAAWKWLPAAEDAPVKGDHGSGWLLHRAFGHLPAGVWTVDHDLRLTSAQGGGFTLVGLEEGNLLGRSIADLIEGEEQTERFVAACRRTLAGHSERLEVEWQGRVWQVLMEPVRGENGVTGILGVALDITEKAETASRLEEERAHLRQIFDQAPGGIVLVNEEDRILDVNQGFQQIFGYSRAEAVGHFLNDLIAPDDRRAEASSLSHQVMLGQPVEAEAVRLRKDGSEVHVAIMGTSMDVADKRRGYAIYRDITHQKELEAQLLHSQRLEAVGQLAGGVAHDFNNALTVILAQVDEVAQRVRDPEVRRELRDLEAAASHAAQLTQGLLTFSRRDVVDPAAQDLDALVEGTLGFLNRSLEDDVQLLTELDGRLPRVKADRNQLQQLVVNLVLNARDAMNDGGGEITVRTRPLSPEEAQGRGLGAAARRGGVLLEVEDTGRGMTPDEVSRVFEPYFTTKPRGRGSGLGLSLVYGIVERADGSITVESEPGSGSVFRVALPAAPEEEAPEGADGQTAGERGTVLLVDDEGPVLRAACRILLNAGHRVLTASSGPQALQLARSRETPPDLVLADVAMPEMSGLELASELETLWPGIRVVLTTGYTKGEWGERLERARAEGWEFIQKPFDAHTLLRKMREALSRP